MSEQLYNSLTQAKVLLRKAFYKDGMRVLDVFAGPGEMWRLAYGETKNYLGIELDPSLDSHGREMIYGRKAIEALSTLKLPLDYDVFDLDAFANPWEEFRFILQNRNLKRDCYVFLTDSLGREYGSRIAKILENYITKNKTYAFKKNRSGIFRHCLHSIVSECGQEYSDLKLYIKKRQPQTIYAGFKLTLLS